MSAPGSDDKAFSSVLCDKCKKPVTVPDSSTFDISWEDATQNLLSSHFGHSQMWPLGYLLGSSYSPFHIERQIPQHRWRDAFEDLLALESGSEMIREKTREEETEVATQIRFEKASRRISKVNELLKADADNVKIIERTREKADSNSDHRVMSWCDHTLENLRKMTNVRLRYAKIFQTKYADNNGLTASLQKSRGQWIASLITSGALRGWHASVMNSAHGELWSINKSAPAEHQGNDSSELELRAHFEEGKPYYIGSPEMAEDEKSAKPQTPIGWFPIGYDCVKEGWQFPHEDDTTSDEVSAEPAPSPPAVRKQDLAAEQIKLHDGTMGIKAIFETTFMNDTVDRKEIVQDPIAVLREVEKARSSIQDRNLGW